MIFTVKVQTQEVRRIFWILFGLTVLTFIGMQITGEPLKTEVAQGGIITFELVGTLSGSQAIIDSWQGPTMTWAGINMGLDFLFLVLYASTIALGCLILAARVQGAIKPLGKLGTWMALGVLIAAVLDVVENIALIMLLIGSDNEFLPQLARGVAIPKFSLVFLSLLYIVSTRLIVGMNKYDFSKGNR